MFGKVINPYEEVVHKATDEHQTEPNWDILLTVWDKVQEDGQAGARNCVAALQKRLQHRSANVQLFSLTLASALVSNCGPPLHREISGKSFTSTLARLVNDRTTHESVKKEVLRLVEEWSNDKTMEEGARELMDELREALRKQNHKFPGDQTATPPTARRNDDALRREEEELQRALEESAKMADPRRGFVASQPPPVSSSSSAKALPQQPQSPVDATSHSESGSQAQRHRRVRAIYDFEGGQGPDELPFVKGDVISVLETVYADWWRGELRGRRGIFPANRVEELPDEPQRASSSSYGGGGGRAAQGPVPTSDAEMEAELFAKSASIDKLLALMRNLSARGENSTDNDELADRYNECMALAPKVVNLIRKYDQKQAELREMNDKFNKAKATYEQMAGYATGPQGYPSQQIHPNGAHHQPQPQQGYYSGAQQPPPHQTGPSDAERAQREHEERERREYEEKYRIYEQELAAYNAAQAAAQAAQQQQYAQQHPGPAQGSLPVHDPYGAQSSQAHPTPAHSAVDPRAGASPPPGATQQWASVQPPAPAEQAAPEPVWDGQTWIYPHHPAPSQNPAASAASPPPAQAYAPSTSQAYPVQPYPEQQQQPPRAAVSPVSSLRSNGQSNAPTNITESLSQLALDPHSAAPPVASPSLARYQLQDGPSHTSAIPQNSTEPQSESNVAQLYQPNVAAAVSGAGAGGVQEGGASTQEISADDQAAAEAWAKYHREKAEYDAYMAQQAQMGAPSH